MALPDGATELVKRILQENDLTKTSLKEVRSMMEKEMNLEPGALDAHREVIRSMATAEIERLQAEAAARAGEGAAEPAQPAEPAQAEGAPAAKRAKKRHSSSAAAEAPGPAIADDGSDKKEKGKGKGTKQRQSNLMTRRHFMENAESLKLQVGPHALRIAPKTFSTNSVGFFTNSKLTVDVCGQPVQLQCTFNCTIVGSKEWSDD